VPIGTFKHDATFCFRINHINSLSPKTEMDLKFTLKNL
jgi:hypothetical protein